MPLVQDQHTIEALAAHAADEPFAQRVGSCAWYGVVSTSMPLVAATRPDGAPNVASLSWMRNCGAVPKGVASRSWWAPQAAVGCRVTARCCTTYSWPCGSPLPSAQTRALLAL